MIKWIDGYEGLYDVTDTGIVRKHNKGEVKEVGFPDRKGYLRVCLTKEGLTKQVKIHKLVADAFIPNVNNLPSIDHIDGNKLNNRVDNLRRCTIEESLEFYRSSKIYSQLEKFKEAKKAKQKDLNVIKNNLETGSKVLLEVKRCIEDELNSVNEVIDRIVKIDSTLGSLLMSKHNSYSYYYDKLKTIANLDKVNNPATGKKVTVNGVPFMSVNQAANYISSKECKDASTVRTEIRRILLGTRLGNVLYKKYEIT